MKIDIENKKEVLYSNILWTINKDYNINDKIDNILFSEIEELNYFRNILYSFSYEIFGKEIYKLIMRNAENNIIIEILFLTLQEFLREKIDKSYFAINHIENNVHTKVYDFYNYKNKKRTIDEEIRYAYYSHKKNIVPKVKSFITKILYEILEFANCDKERYIEEFKKLISRNFDFNVNIFFDSNVEEKKEKAKRNVSIGINQDTKEDIEELEISSAEFSQVDIGKIIEQMKKDMAESPIDKDSATKGRMDEKIIEMFGMPTINKNIIEELQRKLSVGLHEGERILITNKLLDVSEYRKKEMIAILEQNIENFEYRKKIYERNISILSDMITRSITSDLDYSINKCINGALMSNILWRKSVLDDENIFSKKYKDEKGMIIVDILLDASGSQTQRESLVASQGYIIAEALYKSKIPCRVTSFNNLFDYTIIKVYRDYYDDRTKNKNIFMYKAEGSNRDGFAISLTSELLNKREEENKILIILSDGKPNDERPKGAFNIFENISKKYTGDIAIKDTAKAVRKLRYNNVAVLGVFTGNEEDIEVERKIFGKDFAYIRNVNKFSEVVGFYLKKHISNIFEN